MTTPSRRLALRSPYGIRRVVPRSGVVFMAAEKRWRVKWKDELLPERYELVTEANDALNKLHRDLIGDF